MKTVSISKRLFGIAKQIPSRLCFFASTIPSTTGSIRKTNYCVIHWIDSYNVSIHPPFEKEVLGGFLSHPKRSATLIGPVEISRIWSSCTFRRTLWGTFCLYTEICNDRNILVIKCEKHNLRTR